MKIGKEKSFYILAALVGVIIAAYFYTGFSGANVNQYSEKGGSKIFYFYSPNCHYCQQIEPFMEEMSEKYSITYCKIEELSDECKALADEINLKGVPTVAIRNGKTKVLTGVNEVLKLEEVLKGQK